MDGAEASTAPSLRDFFLPLMLIFTEAALGLATLGVAASLPACLSVLTFKEAVSFDLLSRALWEEGLTVNDVGFADLVRLFGEMGGDSFMGVVDKGSLDMGFETGEEGERGEEGVSDCLVIAGGFTWVLGNECFDGIVSSPPLADGLDGGEGDLF